jgi:adenylate cyclase
MGAPDDRWAALERALLGEPDRDGPRVAGEAGVDYDEARRLWRALGFPPIPEHEACFTRRDADMLRAASDLARSGLADGRAIVHMARVIGQALSRVAEAQIAVAPGPLEPTIVAQLEEFLGYAWRRHLLAAARRQAARGELPVPSAPSLTVGFADLVGYTALSRGLDQRQLAELVDRFEELVYAHLPAAGGRVVKMIGDEVMFAAEDARRGAEIALSLVAACRAERDLPELRVGLASGPVLAWAGDLFGTTVNLASRLVETARPDTILVSEATASELGEASGLVLRPLHRLSLDGVGRVRAFALRREEPAGADPLPQPPGHGRAAAKASRRSK